MEDLIKDIKTLLSIDSKYSELLIKTRIDAYVKEQINEAPIHIKRGVENTRVYVKDGAIICELNERETQGGYSVTQGSDTYAMPPKERNFEVSSANGERVAPDASWCGYNSEINIQNPYTCTISRNKKHGDI